MKKQFSRREVLGIGLGAAAGTALLGSGVNAMASEKSKTPETPDFPWKYTSLDVDKVKERAYQSYLKGGCMYAVFEAVAGSVADVMGKPYTDFPFSMSSYGAGGVALWGTLCGTCNGAAMAAAMFTKGKVRNQLISELFTWYENTALPLFTPKNSKLVKPDFKMKSSKSESTLCHISITRWTQASGFESFSKERKERCGRLASDMAGYTAETLNQILNKTYKPKHQVSETANGCLDCHAKGKQGPNEPEVVSKMSCTACHEPHPLPKMK